MILLASRCLYVASAFAIVHDRFVVPTVMRCQLQLCNYCVLSLQCRPWCIAASLRRVLVGVAIINGRTILFGQSIRDWRGYSTETLPSVVGVQ